MKINRIGRNVVFSKGQHLTKSNLEHELNVKRIPSHKEGLDTFVNLYGEKEMKRYGLIKCETCAKRVYKEPLVLNANRKACGDVFICPECGRSYDDKGIVNIIKLDHKDYESKSELFEGLKLDEKV